MLACWERRRLAQCCILFASMASWERQRLAGSALDAAFGGQNIQYLPYSASLDAWAAGTAALPGQKVCSIKRLASNRVWHCRAQAAIGLMQPTSWFGRRPGRRDAGAPSKKYAALAETAALPGQNVCSIRRDAGVPTTSLLARCPAQPTALYGA